MSTQGHHFNKLGITRAPDTTYQLSKSPGILVPEKEDFLRFLPHIGMGLQYWSCDLNHLNKFSSPQPMEPPHEIWLQSA